MSYPRLPFLFRPYFLRELPGWGFLFKRLNIHSLDNRSPLWTDAPTRVIKGKKHGYRMRLDLRDDVMRATYFMGRYYDLNMQRAVEAALGPGDTFVDVGANMGMLTLLGAHLVGAQGRVLAFEPQPECCRYLESTLAENGISNVEVINAGLSEAQGELTLNVLGAGTIMATFRSQPTSEATAVRAQIRCPVYAGDNALAGKITGRLVIKIDVEGYELHCLRGLVNTIDQHRPIVFTEIEPNYLKAAGVTEASLFEFMEGRGFKGFDVGLQRHQLRYRLSLTPVSNRSMMRTEDAVWIPRERTDQFASFMGP